MDQKYAWLSQYPKGVEQEINVPEKETIAGVLASTCQKYKSRVALSCMGAEITYGQLDRLSNNFGGFLQHHCHLKTGDRVAIMLPNVLQFTVAMFGTLKVGGVCVNTNPLYTSREMKHQFKDSGARVLVILDMFLDKLQQILSETDVEHIVVTSIGDQLPVWKGLLVNTVMRIKGLIPKHELEVMSFKHALEFGTDREVKVPEKSAGTLAVLQYTGGTTGVSKGAMLTQGNILANMYQIRAWARPQVQVGEETVLTALPLYHIFALSVNFLTFLSLGCKMILLPKPVPIKNTVNAFKQHKITIMTGVNTLYNALNHDKGFQKVGARHLKIAIAGGMALQKSVLEEFQRITGVKIVEGYGLTEASPVTHCNPLGVTQTPDGACGLPLPSTVSKVVDEKGQEVAVGEVGELWVKGPQIMQGYWQRDGETEKTISDGWLKTGDMAKQDDEGYFYIVDRKKDMILVSGFNVYPNEVEEVLASHPKVLEAAVIGVEDPDSGEAVKAYVVARDTQLTEQELRDYCEKNLAGYKKPKLYEFTHDLPKTNVGKILRRELRNRSMAS